MSNRALILMILFSLTLIAGSLYIMHTLDPGAKPKANSEVISAPIPNIIIDDNFTLTTENGTNFTHQNLKDKFTLIYFGFSNCPDICPTIVQKLSEVAKSLSPNILEKTQFIFVSIDPQRDDISTLKKFTAEFDHKVLGVTGEENEINKLTSSMKVYYAPNNDKNQSDKNYYVDHSSFIYLVNPEVKLIGQFTSNASSEEILDSLKEKMKE